MAHFFSYRGYFMNKYFSAMIKLVLLAGVFISGASYAEKTSGIDQKIYSGFYSREGNDADVAQTTGNNTYVKFYPETRIVRLYIPYPYSKSVTAEEINAAFDAAVKKSTKSAYIRSKFGVMKQDVVGHLDTFRWIDNQVMFDCGKTEPCKVSFSDKSMTVLKPGMVVSHKINYMKINVQ